MAAQKIQAYDILCRMRQVKPVVHHMTNWVTIYDCAHIVKVFGGSPVMAHAPEEAAEMTLIAASLVLNIGTLTTGMVEAMKISARTANEKGTPVLLDACGAGATSFRDRKSFELLQAAHIDILKGNASEIARLCGEAIRTKGVDASKVFKDMKMLAGQFACRYKCVVVVTGPEDIVTDGSNGYLVKNGHPMMADIVGTGCMAASVIGAFAAVEKDLLRAAAAGLSCFGIAAQIAAKSARGPGTFKEKLFDSAYNLNKKTVCRLQRIDPLKLKKAGR
ncbi:MAG TPA: hydroxyethylthiazole kinase [Candidatus Omnitrophota bacterium]|nr:hydroxyethylthiazole kinase [Candidatus Omnitrophota bacterium]HQJ15604.1 hydroxyethylthiazole kinase [Candidatus Omnitrophota bacterium]